MSQPGEIRKEYMEQLKKLQEELQKEREEEERASALLICKLQEEELQERQSSNVKTEMDDVPCITKELRSRQLSNSCPSSLQPVDRISVVQVHGSASAPVQKWKDIQNPPGKENIQRRYSGRSRSSSSSRATSRSSTALSCNLSSSSAANGSTSSNGSGTCASLAAESDRKAANHKRSISVDSNDSITEELRHFKPIKAMPRTPPRRLASGKVLEPMPVLVSPQKQINLPEEKHCGDVISKVCSSPSSPLVRRRLQALAAERQAIVSTMSKGTETDLAGKRFICDEKPEELGAMVSVSEMEPVSSAVKRLRFASSPSLKHASTKAEKPSVPDESGDHRPVTPPHCFRPVVPEKKLSPGKVYRMKHRHNAGSGRHNHMARAYKRKISSDSSSKPSTSADVGSKTLNTKRLDASNTGRSCICSKSKGNDEMTAHHHQESAPLLPDYNRNFYVESFSEQEESDRAVAVSLQQKFNEEAGIVDRRLPGEEYDLRKRNRLVSATRSPRKMHSCQKSHKKRKTP